MAAPFTPPKPTTQLPEVPDWVPPPPTQANLPWANLHTIELADLDSPDPSVVAALISTTKTAIKEDGFLYVTHYGISLPDLHRQFSLAQYLHTNISAPDKQRLLWDPATGLYAGYKPATGWQRTQSAYDGINHFNFYAPQFLDSAHNVPTCILPFMPEIRAFCDYLMHSVNRRLLTLLSRVLEMPDPWLWEHVQGASSADNPVGEGYFRHALYHPLPAEERTRRDGVRMYGHRDFGLLTLLFSVPVTALQVLGKDGVWRFVKYSPGALVVNLGEAMEIVSGGHCKATLHKVAGTPEDQQGCERLSIVLFNASRGDLRLGPAMESPLLRREGVVVGQGVFGEWKALMDRGMRVPTNREWREVQVARGSQIPPEETEGGIRVVEGVKYGESNFLGVKVMLPV